MMNLLRRIASAPGLRTLLLQPRVRRAIASLLALRFLRVAVVTTTPLRFLVADLVTQRGRVRTWRLRSGAEVTLMHRRDTEAFHELFLGGEYEPPPDLVPRLAEVRRILDVGGNIGMFSNWAHARWPEAEITAFEPAPENATVFRSWLARSSAPVELIEAAAMVYTGRVRLGPGAGAGRQVSAVDSSAADLDTLAAVDIFDHLVTADLVKIDIEGAEWPILADSRLSQLDEITLVMEYHRVGAPSLPAYDAARRLLESAGFTVGHHHPNHWGHGVLWAWKGQPDGHAPQRPA